MRRAIGIGIGLVAASFAAWSATASAATFYVDDSSPSPASPCTSPPPANACQTIGAAVTQARSVGGPNTIQVAAGTYTESLNLNNNPGDDGLTIEGASPANTFLVLPNAATFGISATRPNQTVRGLSVEVPGTTTATDKSAIVLFGTSGTLANDEVLMTGGDSNDPAVKVANGPATISHLTIGDNGNSAWTGIGLYIQTVPGPVTVSDSNVQTNERAIETSAASTVIQRTFAATTSSAFGFGTIELDSPGPVSGSVADAALTLDSSLVIGGQYGIVAKNAFTDAMHHQTASATIRDSTIDPLLPRGTDGNNSAYAWDNVANGTAAVTVDSSILVGSPVVAGHIGASGGASSVTCTHSDLKQSQVYAGDSTNGPISCDATTGNAAGNSVTAPSSLFVFNPFGLNWHLLDTAPAIDTGNAAPLAAGESTTDIDGNPRVLNGDGTCPAVRDKGAFEHATVGSDCSPPPGASPGTTTPAPSGKKCKKKRKHRAAAAKKCKKRKKR